MGDNQRGRESLTEIPRPWIAPLAPHWHYTYAAAGNELSQTDPKGNVTSYTYDERGNKLTHKLPGNQSDSWTYDPSNRVVTHTDLNGNTGLGGVRQRAAVAGRAGAGRGAADRRVPVRRGVHAAEHTGYRASRARHRARLHQRTVCVG